MPKLYNALTWLVLLLGLAGSGLAGSWLKTDIEAREYQQFANYCEEIKLKIAARLVAHKQILLSGAAMFDASDNVTRQEWQTYVKRLHLDEHFNGIQGLGFSLWIPPEQLATHQARLRAEGFANYALYPKGKRDAYSAIIFLEPFDKRNARAFSYDMYSEPVRREAMARACDENAVTLSGKVTLVQEINKEDVQAGTLMYAPVYQKNKPIDSLDHRRAALYGWVYSPFRMNDFLDDLAPNLMGDEVTHVHLHIYDGNNVVAKNLLYDNSRNKSHDDNMTYQPLRLKTTTNFNATVWTLQFERVLGTQVGKLDYSNVWIISGSVGLSSLLLFLLLRSYLTTRVNAEIIATRLTKQLQDSENRFRDLFENAPLPYQSLDIGGNLLDVNQAWLNLMGCSRERAIGQFFGDFMSETSKALVRQTFNYSKQAAEITNPIFELLRHDTHEKRLVIVETRIARDSRGLFQRTHCILIDITEHHRTEQELKESEQRFRLLADYAPVLIWQSGTDKLCYYFNQVWLKFTGRTLEQEMGNGWAEGVHPDDLQHCLDTYISAFDANLPFKMEYRLRRHDGQYRWILDTGVPRFAEDNTFLGYIGSCIDITERYSIEQELKTKEEHLRLVNADLQQFTHVAAHHLQEPARRLVSFVQRLQLQLQNNNLLNEDINMSLHFITQSAMRQRALVRDIQLYLAATQPRAVEDNIVVRDTISKVLAKKAQLIQEMAASVDYTHTPSVYIDPPRLHDIFSILLDNALQHGGKQHLHIQIRGEHQNDRVYYVVADDGVGVAEEYRERVLLVFERLHVSENQESTGSGLAIVRRIVESCGGRINLYETVGGGLSVLFDLPEAKPKHISHFF